MGSCHAFFAIDIDLLRNIVGSNNMELMASIIEERGDDLDELNESYEEEIGDGRLPSSNAALQQIVSGAIDPDGDGEMHCQVLLILCEQLASGGFWLVRFGGVAGRFCLVVLAVCV